jgi:hypothetical protein
MGPLQVVTCLFNPIRYKRRYELFGHFLKHMADSGVDLFVVECAFGNRPFEFTAAGNPRHIQVRAPDELWLKENLINLGIQRTDGDHIAWLDSDIHFTQPNWAEEIVEQLQHYQFIQPWSHALYLDPKGGATTRHSSFCHDWVTQQSGLYKPERKGYMIGPDFNWHPGLAWAARREALDAVGGLVECDILGGGDLHMSRCLVGKYEEGFNEFGAARPRDITVGYRNVVLNWQKHCEAHIKMDIGYLDGTIVHYWHGPMWARMYSHKWEIIIRNKYDPNIHLKKTSQGVLQWSAAATPQLRDDLRSYFRIRSEDSVEMS